MGDRFVVGFQEKENDPIIYLYSHWGGEAQDAILAEALDKAQSRWSDAHYATRIVTSQIIGDEWKQNLGFGISVNHFALPDYDTINVVQWHTQSVSVRIAGSPEHELVSVPFDAYVALRRVTS